MIKHLMLACSTLTLVACGQQATTTEIADTTTPAIEAPVAPPAMSNADFAQAVANADAFEIQSSQLAATHAARANVKTFATMMVRDHTATTTQLTTLAPTIGLTAPTATLDATAQGKLDTLRGLSGAAFDTAYTAAQVEAHQNAIQAFEQYAAGAAPGPLLDWANTTLPKLREHLTNAQALVNAA